MEHLKASETLGEHGFLCRTNNRNLYGKLHDHDFYELVLMLDGTSVHTVNKKSFPMSKGQFCFIPPYVPHNLKSADNDAPLTLTVSVVADEMKKLCSLSGKSLSFFFSEAESVYLMSDDDISSVFHSLDMLRFDSSDTKIMRIKSIIVLMLCAAAENLNRDTKYKSTESIRGNPALYRALLYMQEPENLAKGVDALISISGYSVAQLYKIMQKYCGITPHEYISELRIAYAKNMLRYTDKKISVITAELGFSGQSHFSAVFKKATGLTPGKYRSSFSNNIY